ncbi:acyl carrier protein phosphodiesterase [Vibrio tritonius]|uniref:acyl carrier protein phosphodiesterase n=1 Tax=Vibrio tritonius TaxID=1435069 RepID=UPI0008390F5A|nr:ACP phosphodiesterase [Vibrio tritonius]
MNYLAHLHIAEHSQSNLLGNLLGDFVKGAPHGRYSDEVVQGILLHRWVDAYTDRHDIIKQAKALFPKPLQRFAPIALDMFWDHCLASRWNEFSALDLTEFVAHAKQQVKHSYEPDLPAQYLRMTDRMWSGRWLESYQDFDNIEFALKRIATRSERIAPVALCSQSLLANYAALQTLFTDFYPQVLNEAKRVQL